MRPVTRSARADRRARAGGEHQPHRANPRKGNRPAWIRNQRRGFSVARVPWPTSFARRVLAVRTFDWSGASHDVAGALRFWRSLRRENFSIVHLHFGGRAAPFLVRSAAANEDRISTRTTTGLKRAGQARSMFADGWRTRWLRCREPVATNVIGMTPARHLQRHRVAGGDQEVERDGATHAAGRRQPAGAD